MIYKDYNCAARVKSSKKDLPALLEELIIYWLIEDLLCTSYENDDICPPGLKVILEVTIINTGDLKWMAMLLGVDGDGMSNQWCGGVSTATSTNKDGT